MATQRLSASLSQRSSGDQRCSGSAGPDFWPEGEPGGCNGQGCSWNCRQVQSESASGRRRHGPSPLGPEVKNSGTKARLQRSRSPALSAITSVHGLWVCRQARSASAAGSPSSLSLSMSALPLTHTHARSHTYV